MRLIGLLGALGMVLVALFLLSRPAEAELIIKSPKQHHIHTHAAGEGGPIVFEALFSDAKTVYVVEEALVDGVLLCESKKEEIPLVPQSIEPLGMRATDGETHHRFRFSFLPARTLETAQHLLPATLELTYLQERMLSLPIGAFSLLPAKEQAGELSATSIQVVPETGRTSVGGIVLRLTNAAAETRTLKEAKVGAPGVEVSLEESRVFQQTTLEGVTKEQLLQEPSHAATVPPQGESTLFIPIDAGEYALHRFPLSFTHVGESGPSVLTVPPFPYVSTDFYAEGQPFAIVRPD